ncbi:MAG: 1,2-phenylacetyl-CoA epoxidase subunit PaaC [Anaerolineales bacterium]|nr:1,2-phenylacetyl-CoA epoxidase subunit PaaC [Anaerolineales bacterium]
MTEIERALAEKLLALADDELILAHRNSEWTGHAPILEEDIALANIAQDELGHAMLYYELHCALAGGTPDRLAFFREAADFRNVQLVELPKGDWAFTMLRQYLFDAYELALLAQLTHSAHRPLAEVAAKVRNEELYHYKHTGAWVRRLGLGTEESHCRMQTALNELWPYTAQLFTPGADEEVLVKAGITPPPAEVREAWAAKVLPWLEAANLSIPLAPTVTLRRAEHTPHLTRLLAEMQSVARSDPAAEW